MEQHSVARLIGAPPGYVGYDAGGMLTEGGRAFVIGALTFDASHPRAMPLPLSLSLCSGPPPSLFDRAV